MRSGVIIDAQFKNQIYSLLKKESPYDVIIAELEEGKVEVKKNNDVYRMKRGMLMLHQTEQNEEFDYWRAVIPDEVTVKNLS